MERGFTCKKLEVTYGEDKMFLSGPHCTEIRIEQDIPIKITLKQCGMRTITIVAEKEITQAKMYEILTLLEKLLMLFDGCFISLLEIKFSDSDMATDNQLENWTRQMLNNRLSYFVSSDFSKGKVNCLLEYDEVLTESLFLKWNELMDELDIVNQMYLYSIGNNLMPVDLKNAFLIELSEPLFEVVNAYHKTVFASSNPEKKRITLRMCLDLLIKKFGEDIFGVELNQYYEEFLTMMVNSRNRIVHIKRNQKQKYFNGAESILYINKMSILYRHILLQILDIDEDIYHDRLVNCISRWNRWNDVLERLIHKTK